VDVGDPGENTGGSGQAADEDESGDPDDLEPVSIATPGGNASGNNGGGINNGGNGNGNSSNGANAGNNSGTSSSTNSGAQGSTGNSSGGAGQSNGATPETGPGRDH
jgi:hypothetical protein